MSDMLQLVGLCLRDSFAESRQAEAYRTLVDSQELLPKSHRLVLKVDEPGEHRDVNHEHHYVDLSDLLATPSDFG